jgi:hypothetical protein
MPLLPHRKFVTRVIIVLIVVAMATACSITRSLRLEDSYLAPDGGYAFLLYNEVREDTDYVEKFFSYHPEEAGVLTRNEGSVVVAVDTRTCKARIVSRFDHANEIAYWNSERSALWLRSSNKIYAVSLEGRLLTILPDSDRTKILTNNERFEIIVSPPTGQSPARARLYDLHTVRYAELDIPPETARSFLPYLSFDGSNSRLFWWTRSKAAQGKRIEAVHRIDIDWTKPVPISSSTVNWLTPVPTAGWVSYGTANISTSATATIILELMRGPHDEDYLVAHRAFTDVPSTTLSLHRPYDDEQEYDKSSALPLHDDWVAIVNRQKHNVLVNLADSRVLTIPVVVNAIHLIDRHYSVGHGSRHLVMIDAKGATKIFDDIGSLSASRPGLAVFSGYNNTTTVVHSNPPGFQKVEKRLDYWDGSTRLWSPDDKREIRCSTPTIKTKVVVSKKALRAAPVLPARSFRPSL